MFIVGALLSAMPLLGQEVPKPEAAPVKVVTEDYYGTTIEDPYRYMEDLKDPGVINWMKANAGYAEVLLDKIPGKQEMIDKIRELDSRTSSKISNLQITEQNTYFYLKQKPEDEKGKLFMRQGYDGEEKLLFDPDNYRSESGDNYVIQGVTPNHSGNRIGVNLAPNGSENGELIILDADGNMLSDKLELVRMISWFKDDESFVYTKMNSPELTDPNRLIKVKSYKHNLGEEQADDKVFFSGGTNPELNIKPEEIPYVIYDEDTGNELAIAATVSNARKVFMREKGTKSWIVLTNVEDKVSNFATTKDDVYYMSFKDAPNFKILKTSISDPKFDAAEVIVPEPEKGPITDFTVTKDGLYYVLHENGVESRVYFLPNGKKKAQELELPFTAGNAGVSGRGGKFSDVWITISGWTSPAKRYKYTPETGNFEFQPMSTPAEYPELENLMAKEVMVTSHDGVKVPVSILYNKDTKLDGSNPTVIYGYGAYGISNRPSFSPLLLAYTLYDGIFVFAHVRGGGELGEDWHKAGQKLNKPNTWKDAIATAEYLIEEGYTSKEKLGIIGGSAGGIMVGRAITERPDLFAAAAPMVGAMNPLRMMEKTPGGPMNVPEFGSASDPEGFKGLLEMDSYHHLEKGTEYPATLITAGMNDPRVTAWVPAKFAAKMQAANASDKPILFLTDFDSGHGIGDNKSKQFEEFANVFSFLYWQTGNPKFQPNKDIGSK